MNDITPKINPIDSLSSIESKNIKNKTDQNTNGSFGKILKDRINADSHGNIIASSSRLSEIEGPFRILNPASSDPTQLSQKLTDSLDLFERYAFFLGDPDKSLKQAYGILEQILSSTRMLTKELDQHSTDSTDQVSGLKDILTQLMTTARVEQIKFDRGDYL